MKVAILSHASGLHGAEYISFLLAKVFKKDFYVEVFLPKNGALKEKLDTLGVRTRFIPMSWWVAPRIPFFSSSSPDILKNPFLFLTLSFSFLPFSVGIALRFLKDFDIVWSNSIVNPVGAFASLILKKKHVWHIHEVWEDPNLFFPSKKIYDLAYNMSEKIVCVSNFVAKHFENKNPEKIKVVYNSIDEERENILKKIYSKRIKALFGRQKKLKGDNQFLLGVIGKVSQNKNQIFAVKVISELRKSGENVRLLFFGDEDKLYKKRIEKLSHDLGVADYINFMGFKKIEEVYSSVDIVFIPSLVETSSLVAIESMACGVPVIALGYGALPETIGEETLIIKSNSNLSEKYEEREKDLLSRAVQTLRQLIQDKDLYREISIKMRERFEKIFSFHKFSQDIRSVVDSLLPDNR
ncbi:2-deoxystreptamine glucosyltransferase [bacterium HR19]|nr:2-deoxystreptamine glucosyltransferase [bacterium HR19]